MREAMGVSVGVVLMIGLLLSPMSLFAAGIDCGKARHRTEKMICNDMQLKMMDEMLARVFNDLKGKLNSKKWKEMATDQGQWSKRRNGFLCPDVYTCLSTYNQRLIELKRYGDAVSSLKPAQQGMVSNVSEMLTKMEESWGVSDDEEITSLPNRGLRGIYLRSQLTVSTLKDWFKVNPYVSGPHQANGYSFRNKQDFGHYNPKFVAILKKWLDFFSSNPIAQPLAQGFYDNQLLDIAPAYYRMYEYLHAPENAPWASAMLKKYKKAIKAYKILSLKYPEKNVFFAGQIQKIKKLQQ